MTLELNFSKPLLSEVIFFLRSGLGPLRHIFSICWCCERTAKRFTWTGMGTTIFVPEAPFRPKPCEERPALTRFHFALRFWNQILTCKESTSTNRTITHGLWSSEISDILFLENKISNVRWISPGVLTWTSLNLRLVAIWLLSVRLKYFFAWNSLSNSNSCSEVNAVLLRRDFEFGPPLPLESLFPVELPSSSEQSSLSVWLYAERK